jgi:Holliday junction DNA helicase RuvA
VSGIGAKLALAIIAHMSAGQLRQAVLSENLVALSKVPGVGKKTAQRLVLELKDKVLGLSDTAEDLVPQETQRMDQVKLGLQGLGYSPKDSDLAWAAIEELASDPSTSISALMKAALQSLAKA